LNLPWSAVVFSLTAGDAPLNPGKAMAIAVNTANSFDFSMASSAYFFSTMV
jgi:hypothetical protein